MWSGVSSVRVGRESSGGGMGGKWKWARKLPKCLNFLASFFAAIALWYFPEIGLTDVVNKYTCNLPTRQPEKLNKNIQNLEKTAALHFQIMLSIIF